MSTEAPKIKRSAGRPRAFDRQLALEIALDLFWRRGFEGTSTTELTAAMSISQPSLYAAFGSKEGLYREALDLYVLRYGARVQQLLDAKAAAKETLAALLAHFAQQYTDPGHAPGCMIAGGALQGGPASGELLAQMVMLRQAAQAGIRLRLERALSEGELPKRTDAAGLAGYFAMVIQGMAVQAHDGATMATLKRQAKLAMAAWPDFSPG
ncbi:TetR/AcrR family transcriptional regulator [Roseateles albus]|uniref:TetR/AcrR family transcriptional regulator n=1 Tax=Roseateles albus TaxID=2987525 RepID=A0ABT5KJM9_9BURK|nr:TetR/AcrR family transcriptional regulator [Roseateles albus]MDC8774133.1 TetR/AcrR family transcriptional regulator [Roseateles albus]